MLLLELTSCGLGQLALNVWLDRVGDLGTSVLIRGPVHAEVSQTSLLNRAFEMTAHSRADLDNGCSLEWFHRKQVENYIYNLFILYYEACEQEASQFQEVPFINC
ncbi:hypothetical protein H671_6g16478 [Cricetulus griseus]|nr:hypothetical protein H671_6g16478 [Cricetulus griseus]